MFDVVHSAPDTSRFVAGRSRTVGAMLLNRAAETPKNMAWLQKQRGNWETTTYDDFRDQAAAVGTWLLGHGIGGGDKVCIIGGTMPEWCICDMGGLLAGAVTVGAYPTLAAAGLAYIIDHSDSKVVFVQGKDEVDKLLEIKPEIPKVTHVVVWDETGLQNALKDHDWLVSYADVMATEPDLGRLEARQEEIDPESMAIIVYTSGTTGPPKGAMISHANITTLLENQANLVPFGEEDYGLSFLPMAHVAERILSFYGRINTGMGTAFASSIPAVLDEVQEIRPTVFGSVPRIFEKAYAKIMQQVEEASPGKQKIFRWAEGVGRRCVRRWQQGRPIPPLLKLQFNVADRLVFSKLRNAFGGRVKHFVTGAAPIAGEILEFFWAAGFPIYEVYGQTEATVLTHTNRPGAVKLGSVGKVIDLLEEKIADDGEVLVKGPTVFLGYYKNEEATNETIVDGWLHTGDIARRDDDGYLYIVDRKKHIIITAGGKNLTPANIENELKTQDPLISQVHVHGDRRPYLTALVTLQGVEAVEWAKSHGLIEDLKQANEIVAALTENPLADPPGLGPILEKVVAQPVIRERLVKAMEKGNANLAKVETVKRIHVLNRELSVDEDEITPTLKVKRKNVEKKFADTFDRLYEDEGFGITIIGKG